MEKIFCAAVNYNGMIITGRRHKNCYETLRLLGIDVEPLSRKFDGFLTTENRFVDRYEGWEIAENNNQIKFGYESAKNEGSKSMLISENLYYDETIDD